MNDAQNQGAGFNMNTKTEAVSGFSIRIHCDGLFKSNSSFPLVRPQTPKQK